MASKVISTILNLKDNFSKTISQTTSNTKKFQSEIKKTQSGVKEMQATTSSAFSGILGTVAKLGIALGAGVGIKTMITNASNAQATLAQMDAVLESTKSKAGMSKDALIDLATAQGNLTKFSKGTNEATENMLLTFTGIGKKVFPDTLVAVNNMSQALGQDTKSSAIQLGKALQDPVAGVTALQRVGVKLTSAQADQVKAFMKTGQAAKAQQVILKELNTEFGNSAIMAGRTFSGQLTILKNNLTEMGTNIGMKILPYLNRFVSYIVTNLPTIQKVAERVSDAIGDKISFVANIITNFTTNILPKLRKDISNVVDIITKKLNSFGVSTKTIKGVISSIASVLPAFAVGFLIASEAVKGLTKVHDLLKTSFLTSPIFWIVAGIGLLTVGFIYAYKNCVPFRTEINNVLLKMKDFGTHISTVLLPIIKQLVTWLKANVLPVIKVIASFIVTSIIPAIVKLANYIKTNVLPIIMQVINWIVANVVPVIVNIAGIILKTVVPIITTIAALLKQFFTDILVPLFNLLGTVLPPIIAVIVAIVQFLWKNILAPLAIFITNVFANAFSTALPIISTAFSFEFAIIGTVIKTVTAVLKGVIDFVSGVFTGNWKKAWSGIKEIFSGIWTGLGDIVKTVLNTMIGGINDVIKSFDSLSSVKLPAALGGGTIGIKIPTIPKFASGTQYFKGGLATINEKGGENVVLPNGSKVIPHDQTVKDNAKGSVIVNVTVQGNVIGNEEYANEMGTTISKKLILALANM